jgi:pyridoxal phosphate enzyme (YggS family)
MSPIAANLQAIHSRIRAAAGGDAGRVRLVAVSKTQPAETVRTAFAAGQRAFGENYVQEALAKIEALRDLDIEWHYIGPIQSNKTGALAEHFAWVHGVDRLKVANALSRLRNPAAPALNICLQVNVSGETSKSGVSPKDALSLARDIAPLANLKLRGLMTIIENTPDAATQRAQFRLLRDLKEEIAAAGIPLDTLSMGMSQDFEIAIEEGATLVRIGSAVFGQREKKVSQV